MSIWPFNKGKIRIKSKFDQKDRYSWDYRAINRNERENRNERDNESTEFEKRRFGVESFTLPEEELEDDPEVGNKEKSGPLTSEEDITIFQTRSSYIVPSNIVHPDERSNYPHINSRLKHLKSILPGKMLMFVEKEVFEKYSPERIDNQFLWSEARWNYIDNILSKSFVQTTLEEIVNSYSRHFSNSISTEDIPSEFEDILDFYRYTFDHKNQFGPITPQPIGSAMRHYVRQRNDIKHSPDFFALQERYGISQEEIKIINNILSNDEFEYFKGELSLSNLSVRERLSMIDDILRYIGNSAYHENYEEAKDSVGGFYLLGDEKEHLPEIFPTGVRFGKMSETLAKKLIQFHAKCDQADAEEIYDIAQKEYLKSIGPQQTFETISDSDKMNIALTYNKVLYAYLSEKPFPVAITQDRILPELSESSDERADEIEIIKNYRLWNAQTLKDIDDWAMRHIAQIETNFLQRYDEFRKANFGWTKTDIENEPQLLYEIIERKQSMDDEEILDYLSQKGVRVKNGSTIREFNHDPVFNEADNPDHYTLGEKYA